MTSPDPSTEPDLAVEVFPPTLREVMAALAAQGIETRPTFYPLYRMPPYAALARDPSLEFPGAENAMRGISLPTFEGLTGAEIDEVVAALAGLVRG